MSANQIPNIVIAGFTGDRSGSMCSMGNAPSKGLYSWITDQKKSVEENSQTGKMFVSTFDSKHEIRIDGENISDVNVTQEQCRNWMEPRSMTKLYDSAIADLTRLMRAKEEFEANMAPMLREIDPNIVMVWACLTDGFDNSSMSTVAMFRQKVEEAKAAGVKCFFLAANQDAISTGQQYGFDASCSMTIGADRQTSANAMRCLSQVTQQVSQGVDDFQGFTSMMRQRSAPPPPTSFSTQATNIAAPIPTLQAFPVMPPQIQRQIASPIVNLRQGAL